jgi:hypothetical protein
LALKLVEIERRKQSITIKQSTYIDAILKKYRMEGINPVKTPMDLSLVLEPREQRLETEVITTCPYWLLDVHGCCHKAIYSICCE